MNDQIKYGLLIKIIVTANQKQHYIFISQIFKS